ncbi:MAG: hypothetical protein AABZ47_16105 [Planctomycetota bacterium]
MANPQGNVRRRMRSVIRGVHGEIILSIDSRDVTIFEPDGGITKRRLNENIQLVCGAVYNPVMSAGHDPAMLVSVCQRCRAPKTSLLNSRIPSHGLCSTEAGAHCHGCGEFLCPGHTVRCRDHRSRCLPCYRRSRLRSVLRQIFLKREP